MLTDQNISVLKIFLSHINNNKYQHYGYRKAFLSFIKNKITENNEWKTLLLHEKDKEIQDIIQKNINNNIEDIKNYCMENSINHFDNTEVFLTLSSGLGGEESTLFVKELFNIYSLFFRKNKWKYEIIEKRKSLSNGIKIIKLRISGKNVFKLLKFEYGIQRVQRVPITEKTGRVHTSTCGLTLFPIIKHNTIEITNKDIRVDYFRASGKGGQHVNKTETAVRIKHIPTNIIVTCQEERDQFQNYERAKIKLQQRLLQHQTENYFNQQFIMVNTQISNYNRCEKVRTFNYHRNVIVDHRISYSQSLEQFEKTNFLSLIYELMFTIELKFIIYNILNLSF